MVKIGIIGCGAIGSVHADAYAKNSDAKVVALCDILPDKLKEKALRHTVEKNYANYLDLLNDPEVEAVSICVPNDMHHVIAIDAFKAGKHVFLEKPMTLDAEKGRAILAARDASGKQLQMGMVWRQNPESKIIKAAVENGRLGEIYQIRLKYVRRRGIPGLGGWFTTKEKSGGGCLIDIAVHYLDLAMYLADLWEPTRVSAKVYTKFGTPMKDYHYVSMWAGPPKYDGTFDVDDYAAGLIRFGRKATLSFEVAWACNADDETSVELLGTKGGVKVCSGRTILRTEVDGHIADVELFYDKNQDMFAAEMVKFTDAVQGRGKVAATGEEGVITMRLLDAIYKSSELDCEVEV